MFFGLIKKNLHILYAFLLFFGIGIFVLLFTTSSDISQTIQMPSGVTCSAGICSGDEITISDTRCLPDIMVNRLIDDVSQFGYHNFSSLTILSGGVLQICDISGALYIHVSGKTQIDSSGKIDISGKAFLESPTTSTTSSIRPSWLRALDTIAVDKKYDDGFVCGASDVQGCFFLGAFGGRAGVGNVGSGRYDETSFQNAIELINDGNVSDPSLASFVRSGDGFLGPKGGNGALFFSNGEDGESNDNKKGGSGGLSSTFASTLGGNSASFGKGGKGGGALFLQTDIFINEGMIVAKGLSGESGGFDYTSPGAGLNISFVTNEDCVSSTYPDSFSCKSSVIWVDNVDICIFEEEVINGGNYDGILDEAGGLGNRRCQSKVNLFTSDACGGTCYITYSAGAGGYGSGGSGGGGGGGGIVVIQASNFRQNSGFFDLSAGSGGGGSSISDVRYGLPISFTSAGANRLAITAAVAGLNGLNGMPGRTLLTNDPSYDCKEENTFGGYAKCNINTTEKTYGGASGGSGGGGGGGGGGQHGIILFVPNNNRIIENSLFFQDRTRRSPVALEDHLYDKVVRLAISDANGDLRILSNTVRCLPFNNNSPFLVSTSEIDESNLHVFNNVTIEVGGILTVCDDRNSRTAGFGNLQIKVQGNFVNEGIIDLRGKGPLSGPPDWIVQNIHPIYTRENNLINENVLPISGGNGGSGTMISAITMQLVPTATSLGGKVSSNSLSDPRNIFRSVAEYSNSGGGGGAGGLAMQRGGNGANGGSGYQHGLSGLLGRTRILDPFLIAGRGGIGGRSGGLLFLDVDGVFDNRKQILLDGSDGEWGTSSGYYRVRTSISFVSNIIESSENGYFCEGFDGGSGGGGGGGGGGIAYIQAGDILNFGNITSFGGFGGRGGDTPLYSGGVNDYIERNAYASFGTGRTTNENIVLNSSTGSSCGYGGAGGAGGKGADGIIYIRLKGLRNSQNAYHQGQQIPRYSSLTQIIDIGPTIDLVVNEKQCLPPFRNSDVPLDRISSFESSNFKYSNNFHTFRNVRVTSTGVLTVCKPNNFNVISSVGTGNLHLKINENFIIEEGGLIDLRAKGDLTTPLQYSFFSGSSLVGDRANAEKFIRGVSLADNDLCTLRLNNQVNQLGYSTGISSQGVTNHGGRFLESGEPRSQLLTSLEQLYILFNQYCKSRFSALPSSDYSSNILSFIGRFGEVGGFPGGTFYLEANNFENKGEVLLQGADGKDGEDAPYLFFSSSLQPRFQLRGIAGFGSGGGGGGLAIIKARTVLNFGSIRVEGGNGGRGGASSLPGALGASQTYSSHLNLDTSFGSGVGGGRGENGPILFVHSDPSLVRTLDPVRSINEPYSTIGSCYECSFDSNYCNLILFLQGCFQESYIPSLNFDSNSDLYYQNIYFGTGLSPRLLSDENWIGMDLLRDLLNAVPNTYWLQVERLFISEENILGVLGLSFGLGDFWIKQVSYQFDDISFERHLCLKGNRQECISARLPTNVCLPSLIYSFLVDGCTYSSIDYTEQGLSGTSLGYNVEGRQFNRLYGVDVLPVFELSDGLNRLSLSAIDSLERKYRSQPKSIWIDQYAPCDNIRRHDCSISFQDASRRNGNLVTRNGISTFFLNDFNFSLTVDIDEKSNDSGISTSGDNFIFFFLKQENSTLSYFSSARDSVRNVTDLFNKLNPVRDQTCSELFELGSNWFSMRDGAFVATIPLSGDFSFSSATEISPMLGAPTTLFMYLSRLVTTDTTIWFVGCVQDEAGNWSRIINNANSIFLNSKNLNLYEGQQLPLILKEYDATSIDLEKNEDQLSGIFLPTFSRKIFVDLSSDFDEQGCSTEPCSLVALQGVVRGGVSSPNQVDTIAFHPSSYANFLTISGNANLVVGIRLPSDHSGIRRVWYRLDVLGTLNNMQVVDSNSLLSSQISLRSFQFLEIEERTVSEALCREIRQSNSGGAFTTDVNFCFAVSVTNQDASICILLEDHAGNIHGTCNSSGPLRNLEIILTDYEAPNIVMDVHLEGLSEEDVQSTTLATPEIFFVPSTDVGSSGMERYVICYFLTEVRDITYSSVSSTDLLNLYSSLQSTSNPCPFDSFVYGTENTQQYKVFSQEILYSIGGDPIRSFRTSQSLNYGLWRFIILSKDRAGNYSQPYLYLLNIDDGSSFLQFDDEYARSSRNQDFLNGAVSPQRGSSGNYSFRIRYFDFSGRCPTKSELHLDLNGNGFIEAEERLLLLPATCRSDEVIGGKSYYINDYPIFYIQSSKSCESFYQITKGCVFYKFVFENAKRSILGEGIQNQFLFLHPYAQNFTGEVKIHNNLYTSNSNEFPTVVLKPPSDESFPIRILIMNQKGDTVRILVDKQQYSSALPDGYIRWDTRSNNNQLVSSGVYYLVYNNARGTYFQKKIIVIR